MKRKDCPLTERSYPLPLADFADAIVMGEADDIFVPIINTIFDLDSKTSATKNLNDTFPHVYCPELSDDDMPIVAKSEDINLPARSQIVTPNTELREMFLIEPERGCHRRCAYCIMRQSTNGGMRIVKKEKFLDLIPKDAKRVGLVGAATTDHPNITDITNQLADRNLEVGLSSLRADRLNDAFMQALERTGTRVLTTASDSASERLRKTIRQSTSDKVLLRAAKLTAKYKMKRLKLYMMLGIPGEEDSDVDELIRFSTEISKIIPLSLGIAPFCAKRNTPLDGTPFAGIDVVNARLKQLRKGVKGRVDIRPTSARWAWVEYILAQGGRAEGRAVIEAFDGGARFRDYEKAFARLPKDRPERKIVRPPERMASKHKRNLNVVAS